MPRNLEWYELNEQRSWPLADQATLIDDSGQRLPHQLLADINVWFPDSLGEYVYLGAITVGPSIATITLIGTGAGTPPVAAVSISGDIDPYRHYALEALYPGVGGWVVFGSGLKERVTRSYRFSTSEQSILIPHVARKYTPALMPTIGSLNSLTALSGIVRLKGGDDIEIVKESREINEIVRDVAVIRLKSKPEIDTGDNLLEKYAGPCGQRPESNNCGGTPPLEFINSVAPDCCGNLTIEFRGCANVIFVQNESCSVAVGCQLGLGDACVTPDRLPDDDGNLPNTYDNPCDTATTSEESSLTEDASVQTSGELIKSRPATVLPEHLDYRLPYVEDFSSRSMPDYRTVHGKFEVVADGELPIYGGFSPQSSPGGRNLMVWKKGLPQTPDWTVYYKKLVLHFSMRLGHHGVLHTGGLMLNYNELRQTGWAVELDHEGTFTGTKGLRIAYYKGSNSTTFAFIPIRNLSPDIQYRLEVSVLPDESIPETGWISGRLTNSEPVDSPTYVNELIKPLMVSNFGDGKGLFGFQAYRSQLQFNRLHVDNVEAT